MLNIIIYKFKKEICEKKLERQLQISPKIQEKIAPQQAT